MQTIVDCRSRWVLEGFILVGHVYFKLFVSFLLALVSGGIRAKVSDKKIYTSKYY